MNRLEINLIRSRVPGVRHRRNIHLAFLAYLVFSGVLLIWVANLSARRLVEADYHRRDWRHSLSVFAQARPADKDPEVALDHLNREVQAAGTRIAMVEQLLQQRVPAARLLLGLRHPLPPGIRLVDVSYDRVNRRLQFGLAMPDEAAGTAPLGPKELTARWAADPLLSEYVRDIKPVRTERVRMSDQPSIVERYSATVGKGGADHGSGTLPP